MPLVALATCNLSQWALDFDGNEARIAEAIRRAKAGGARYLLTPELCTVGYGAEDHFLEADTFRHSWATIAHLLAGDLTDGILVDLGAPVLHCGVRYNCRVFVLNRRIVLIRPKARGDVTATGGGGRRRGGVIE
jgi:NAD+ synthase (glutamine-hydrolysing)